MEGSNKVEPFIKWAGGKRKILKTLEKHMPSNFSTYYEPFVGSGALLFYLKPKKAVINDINTELINCYAIIKSQLKNLTSNLEKHINAEEYYYYIRNLDRLPEFSMLTEVERAARFIYLNRTCFNGLWRENCKGYMNTPYGYYKNPGNINYSNLENVSRYLNSNNVVLFNCDFPDVLSNVKANDFVYFDPPYVPLTKTSSFTSYSKKGFDISDQIRLKLIFDDLTRRGCKCMLSNSYTDQAIKLYNNYKIIEISASRSINSNTSKRGSIKEILVVNY